MQKYTRSAMLDRLGGLTEQVDKLTKAVDVLAKSSGKCPFPLYRATIECENECCTECRKSWAMEQVEQSEGESNE